MEPTRKTDTQDLGQLIRQLSDRKITQERFSITMPLDELVRVLTAAYIAEVSRRGFQAVIDADARARIRSVASWLCNPHGKCGLMLQGVYGNGKTTMLYAVCSVIEYLFHSDLVSRQAIVRVIDAKELVRIGSDKDRAAEYRSLVNAPMLAIDDIGTEPAEVLIYGMVHTPVRDLLEERYKQQLLTIVSTNLLETPDKKLISGHYGPRVRDRLQEMMHIVVFNTPSYRGKLQELHDSPVTQASQV